jgi:hypothetical protein
MDDMVPVFASGADFEKSILIPVEEVKGVR